MNGINTITTLLVFSVLLFTVYGELKRKILLNKLIRDKNLSRMLINCNECSRLAKTMLLTIAGILLCLSLVDFKVTLEISQPIGRILASLGAYDSGELNAEILLLEVSFCLLLIEQVLPTRKR